MLCRRFVNNNFGKPVGDLGDSPASALDPLVFGIVHRADRCRGWVPGPRNIDLPLARVHPARLARHLVPAPTRQTRITEDGQLISLRPR